MIRGKGLRGAGPSRLGGKAVNLVRLQELGHPVPPFYVISTEALRGEDLGPRLRPRPGATPSMAVRLLDARLRAALIEARVPFRFGIAEMREIVHLFLFATVEVDGCRATGVAAENLPPKWFTKERGTSYRADVEEMVGVVESACTAALASGRRESVFALWQAVFG